MPGAGNGDVGARNACFRTTKRVIPSVPEAITDATQNKKSEKPMEIAVLALYFKNNNLDGVNLTFFEDLYLPLFVGDVGKSELGRG